MDLLWWNSRSDDVLSINQYSKLIALGERGVGAVVNATLNNISVIS
jgi:hypothetical protein